MKILEDIIKKIFSRKIKGIEKVSSIIKGRKLILADVGSTGGLQKTWQPLRSITKTYSFDPDERAVDGDGDSKEFRVALWKCDDKKDLYLTKFPSASSLKLPNKKILNSFPNADDHEVICKKKIKVAKMDDILSSHNAPDFLKIDAEGSDFEILQGAETTLARDCLGLQVEVQFVERNISSKNFGTIDNYLQKRGFTLINLQREFWLRKNMRWGPHSQAQIIWADALYFLSIESFIKMIEDKRKKSNDVAITKFVLICVAHGAHDYAYDLLERLHERHLMDDSIEKKLKSFIIENIASTPRTIITEIMLLTLAIAIYLGSFFIKKYRTKARELVRQAISRLFKTGLLLSSRTGRIKNFLSDN